MFQRRQLLIETHDATVQKDHKGNYFIEGIYLSTKPNANKRRYSAECLSEAVEHIQDQIKAGRMVGTLGHEESMTVSPEKVSHVVQALKRTSDGSWYGRSKVLHETNAGSLLKKLISGGVGAGISSRGCGESKYNPTTDLHEVSNFRIVSLDSVIHPSTNEHVNMIMEAAGLYEVYADPQQHTAAYMSQAKPTGSTQSLARELLMSLGNKELLKDFDKEIMPYTDPNFQGTFTTQLEKDRFELIQKLLQVQKQIALQADQGVNHDKYAAYARLIAKTSDPLKRATYKREAMNEYKTDRIIQETINLFTRQGRSTTRLSDPDTPTIIKSLRDRAGSGIKEWKEKSKE